MTTTIRIEDDAMLRHSDLVLLLTRTGPVIAPISTNPVLSCFAEHVFGLPRSH